MSQDSINYLPQTIEYKTSISHVTEPGTTNFFQTENGKSVWDELSDFETKEAVEILKKCGLDKDMTVIDMGCGHAHYTIPAAIVTGEKGRVIAVEKVSKVLKEAKKRIEGLNLSNLTMLNTDENGLSQYENSVDFIILYDVLHGIFSESNFVEPKTEFIKKLSVLLKDNGILSLALYSEIEHKEKPMISASGKGKKIPITHEEAISPYIELVTTCGFLLNSIVDKGGVHFDDFHSPYRWKKYGEVRVGSLERRNIYNFIKMPQ